jgi:hypothetical protein
MVNQLTIFDLDFCESELPKNREIQGGISFGGSFGRAAYAVSSDTAGSAGYFVSYNFDKNGYSVVAGADFGAAYAAAASGAGSDGGTSAFAFSTAGASTF